MRMGFRIAWAGAMAIVCMAGLPAMAQSPLSRGGAWVVADFDGDHKPDLVTLSSLTGEAPVQASSFDSSLLAITPHFFTQRLRARDLDGDMDRDLVLETTSSVAIAVWLNDGSGHFARANLEDFRFQLAHEDSHTCSAPLRQALTEISDECPQPGCAVPVSGMLPPRSSADVEFGHKDRFPLFSQSGTDARGPPSRS